MTDRALWPTLVLWVSLVGLAAGGVMWVTPSQPPNTVLWALPPFFIGLYIATSATWMRQVGLYASIAGEAPTPVHVGLQLVGVLLVAGAALFVVLLPTPGDRRAHQHLTQLESLCHGEPAQRVQRQLLPSLNALIELRATRDSRLQAEIDRALTTSLTRCTRQLETAFGSEQGAHISWRRLRDWSVQHPTHGPTSPVHDAPWIPLQRTRPAPQSVEIDL